MIIQINLEEELDHIGENVSLLAEAIEVIARAPEEVFDLQAITLESTDGEFKLADIAQEVYDRVVRLRDSFNRDDDLELTENDAFSLLFWGNELKCEVLHFLNVYKQLNPAKKSNTGRHAPGIISRINSILHNVLSKIWNIISFILTPTEWKLSGELGTNFNGFSRANAEITFGAS